MLKLVDEVLQFELPEGAVHRLQYLRGNFPSLFERFHAARNQADRIVNREDIIQDLVCVHASKPEHLLHHQPALSIYEMLGYHQLHEPQATFFLRVRSPYCAYSLFLRLSRRD